MIRRSYSYWRTYGTANLLRKMALKLLRAAERRLESKIGRKAGVPQVSPTDIQATKPLRTYSILSSQIRRVTVVTDHIEIDALFGGATTGLIVSALLAAKLGAQLRIVTRTQPAPPNIVEYILSIYEIRLEHDIQFRFAAPYDQKYELDFSPDEVFVTTSWWTTAAALPSVPNRNIIFLLQEDERTFYPFEGKLPSSEVVFRNSDIRFLISTKALFDYFVQEGFDNIATQGKWFEPVFPAEILCPWEKPPEEKHRLFFYARPHHSRNLFDLGVEVIEQAITQNILNLDQWEIYLVGKKIPDFTFGEGYRPIYCEKLTWSEYARLFGTVDLEFSLMYSPCPSSRSMGLIASGAVVVTGRFPCKREQNGYSRSLICANLERDALIDALKKGISVAMGSSNSKRGYRSDEHVSAWQQTFAETIQELL